MGTGLLLLKTIREVLRDENRKPREDDQLVMLSSIFWRILCALLGSDAWRVIL